MNETLTELADMMLDNRTFELRPERPVRWASGALMPVYNDNRRLLSHPRARTLVADACVASLHDAGVNPDGIVGTATGGIAPATTLADRLGVRLYYVRSSAKGHGLGRRVEGAGEDAPDGEVVLIEDAVSTGGSSASAAAAVGETGATLRYGICVFSYGFERADDAFGALPFEFSMHALLRFDQLFGRARERGIVTDNQATEIERWLADPFAWEAAHTPEDGGTN